MTLKSPQKRFWRKCNPFAADRNHAALKSATLSYPPTLQRGVGTEQSLILTHRSIRSSTTFLRKIGSRRLKAVPSFTSQKPGTYRGFQARGKQIHIHFGTSRLLPTHSSKRNDVLKQRCRMNIFSCVESVLPRRATNWDFYLQPCRERNRYCPEATGLYSSSRWSIGSLHEFKNCITFVLVMIL
jgi:hypothetical protein